ncbi:MAG: NAD+ synthase [Promethearchaeota archaeon]
MRIALAQINPHVGNMKDNVKKITIYIKMAIENEADLVIFPELAITGYPVQDLIFISGFVDENIQALDEIRRHLHDITAIIGFIDKNNKNSLKYFNAAAVLEEHDCVSVIHKQLLPNYDVFDELRFFEQGKPSKPVNIKSLAVGIAICEDLWDDNYDIKVIKGLVESGAELVVVINASPYFKRKIDLREKIIREKAVKFQVPMIYLNMVGGQDEITFDGYSFVMDQMGNVVFRAPAFEEGLYHVEIPSDLKIPKQQIAPKLPIDEEIFKALSLNLRDYFFKIGIFNKILLGLSGGIDSAFTATVAVDAVGPEKVTCIYMPTKFNSDDSFNYSKMLCENLGCEFIVFPIEEIFEKYETEFKKKIPDNKFDVSDENLQARIRSNILMYYSNKFRYLLVSTGNKSEISTGYCTLYGDTSGGKNVPGDLFKTELIRICKNYINQKEEIIPSFIINRPPTAELRENQKDEDSLPPYSILDQILEPMIERFKSVEDLVKAGFDEKMVRKVQNLVKNAEFKRAQLVQTIKISPKAFGIGRRMPIVNGFDYNSRFNCN